MAKGSCPRVPLCQSAPPTLSFTGISLVSPTLWGVCYDHRRGSESQRVGEAGPESYSGQAAGLGCEPQCLIPDFCSHSRCYSASHSFSLNPLLQLLLCCTVLGFSGLPGKADSIYPCHPQPVLLHVAQGTWQVASAASEAKSSAESPFD